MEPFQRIFSLCALLLVVANVLCSSSVTITTQPTNITEIMGRRVIFTCGVQDDPLIDWIVEVPTLDMIFDTSSQAEELFAMGFISGELIEYDDYLFHINLTIPAIAQNNNTIVICRSFGFETCFSDPASLKVLGPPSQPEPVMILIDPGTIRLDWSAPFTWKDHPIIGYHVTLFNSSEPFGETIPTWTSNDTSFNHSWPHENELLGSRCDLLVFSVTASSDIGESSLGNVSSGFPIQPDKALFIDCDTCQVSFQKSGFPQFRALIQLPHVCTYQTANYTISLETMTFEENTTLEIVSASYSGQGPRIPLTMDADLTVNRSYSLRVTVTTVAGNSSISKNFSTEFSPPSVNANPAGVEVYTLIGVTIVALVIGVPVVLIIAVFLTIKNCNKKEVEANVPGNATDGNYNVENGDINLYESIEEYQEEHQLALPPPNGGISPCQMMSSGFPNLDCKPAVTKPPVHSRSTESSMNEYVISVSNPSTPKKENIAITTIAEQPLPRNSCRVSTSTMGEESAYTYMKSFSVQDKVEENDA